MVWRVYQGLAWFYALAIAISLSFQILYVRVEYFDTYRHLPYLEYGIQLIFMASCVGAIARRRWAACWVSATAVWCLAIYWAGVPALIERAVLEICYGGPISIGRGLDSGELAYRPYVYLLAKPIGVGLLLGVIAASQTVAKHQAKPAEGGEAGWKETGRLLYIGVSVIFLGLAFKWLDVHTESQTYGMTIGTYMVVAGAVAILIWHVFAHKLFIAGSVASASSILFIHTPAMSPAYLNLVLWVPVMCVGFLNLLRKGMAAKLRVAVVCLPVLFLLIGFTGSAVDIPVIMCFGAYHKPTAERPGDFPEYLQVPAGANDVRYTGGNRPSLFFTVKDPHPASKTLAFITTNLERAGWKKLEYDLLGPELESSHLKGWYSPLEQWFGPVDPNREAQRDRNGCLWDAWWINDADETVQLRLTYRIAEEGKTDWSKLYGSISVSPADPAHLEYIRYYRQVHTEGMDSDESNEP